MVVLPVMVLLKIQLGRRTISLSGVPATPELDALIAAKAHVDQQRRGTIPRRLWRWMKMKRASRPAPYPDNPTAPHARHDTVLPSNRLKLGVPCPIQNAAESQPGDARQFVSA